MIAVLLPWLGLAVCALLIAYAGRTLTRFAEAIADLAALPKSWVALVLLAAAASLRGRAISNCSGFICPCPGKALTGSLPKSLTQLRRTVW